MTIIRNARLISELTEGFNGQSADVFIEGKTLMPGLWDLHAHLSFRTQTSNTDAMMNNLGEELFGCYGYAKEYLKHGYTTVRDCASTKETALYARNAINRGDLIGPRVIACGLIITPTTRGNKMFPSIYTEVNSPDELKSIQKIA